MENFGCKSQSRLSVSVLVVCGLRWVNVRFILVPESSWQTMSRTKGIVHPVK